MGPILTLDEVKNRHLLEVIDKCKGDIALAAKTLGIGRTTLYRFLGDYLDDARAAADAKKVKGSMQIQS